MIDTNRLIEAIEDRARYETSFALIMSTAETGELPPYGILPVFNDTLATDSLRIILELITGEKYTEEET